MDHDIILGDFNWRGDMAMQKVFMSKEGLEVAMDYALSGMRADKRDDDIFAPLQRRLQHLAPKTAASAGTCRSTTSGQCTGRTTSGCPRVGIARASAR